ncbi:MFS transporter [Gordonia sp. HY366]|uniref:MFS transporter n=2 Tax=Gordonia liuliyuniae TaxID=2911517 RepID=A0ABS9IR85_9ACTN|nr:MFS transporter [Gordonia liuliyuniae]MCF8588073.1 MFS transporter [Gordonia liuliyuniae]
MSPRPGVDMSDAVERSAGHPSRRRLYPWIVFALAFALLLSDYMSRQVLSAVFVPLGQELDLDKGQLGSLISVVALMVGLLTLPVSILADRWGRVRSLTVMAVVWSLATLACAFAQSYEQLLIARFFVGAGEAAYGSVGIALVLGLFAPRVHAALSAAFMAGGSFGTMIGTAIGGVVAVHVGWRWSIGAMAVLGLLLVAAFKLIVTEVRVRRSQYNGPGRNKNPRNESPREADDVTSTDVAPEPETGELPPAVRAPLSSLFTNPAVMCAYIGSGLQMFMAAVMLTWLPTYFKESYGMGVDEAAGTAAVFVMLVGSGMIVCGCAADRVSRTDTTRKWTIGIAFCGVAFIALLTAFRLETGPGQLILLGIGAFFCAGCSGTAAATVASLTHRSVQASAMGTLTLANNLLGLAAAPFLIGVLADHLTLLGALRVAPLVYLPAVAAMYIGYRLHPRGVAKLRAVTAGVAR